jgi:RNA polymerase sigma-70 factor (ECF subfamily)
MHDGDGHREPDAQPEGALVRRAQAGDELALTSLFDGHADALRRRIRGRLSPAVRRKLSESDVMQEACMVASRRLEEFEFRGQGSFGAWLGRIADNTALKAARQHAGTAKRNVHAEVSHDMRAETAQHAGEGQTASRLAMAAEMRERMAQALAGLSDDHRAVLELLQQRRLSFTEAGELMGRSVNAIKKLHARALGELASKLGVRGRGRHGP